MKKYQKNTNFRKKGVGCVNCGVLLLLRVFLCLFFYFLFFSFHFLVKNVKQDIFLLENCRENQVKCKKNRNFEKKEEFE